MYVLYFHEKNKIKDRNTTPFIHGIKEGNGIFNIDNFL